MVPLGGVGGPWCRDLWADLVVDRWEAIFSWVVGLVEVWMDFVDVDGFLYSSFPVIWFSVDDGDGDLLFGVAGFCDVG